MLDRMVFTTDCFIWEPSVVYSRSSMPCGVLTMTVAVGA